MLTDRLHSQIPGVVWPPIVGGHDGAVLALLFQMENDQWLSSAELQSRQSRQLISLLDHARRHCDFYRERLPPTVAEWSTTPLLTRKDLQSQSPRIRADTYPQAHGKSFEISTGGSTAEPITVLRTALTQLFYRAATLRDHLWHRRDLSASMAIIRQFHKPVDSTRPGEWGDVLRSGPAWHLPISTEVNSQVDWLKKIDPEILLTYPPNLEALLLSLRKRGIALPCLKEIRTISGALTPALREQCMAALGVPLTDLYSAQEFGVIALQCPESGLLHLQAEHLLVEILDAQGRPCSEGEIGQVVITDLHNFAMPLIRYALGDWAEVGTSCSCGRGLPTLRRVMGRHRNMAVSPQGERFWPSLDARIFLEAVPHLQQYQFRQTSCDAIVATLVCQPAPTQDQLQRLQASLECALGHKYRWLWQIQAATLPLSSSGKFEEFHCAVVGI